MFKRMLNELYLNVAIIYFLRLYPFVFMIDLPAYPLILE